MLLLLRILFESEGSVLRRGDRMQKQLLKMGSMGIMRTRADQQLPCEIELLRSTKTLRKREGERREVRKRAKRQGERNMGRIYRVQTPTVDSHETCATAATTYIAGPGATRERELIAPCRPATAAQRGWLIDARQGTRA